MYKVQVKGCFDSAHFLKGYEGKCSNLHGHRWVVEVEIRAESLQEDGPGRGMVMDFKDLKDVLSAETDRLDHSLLIEEGSLRPETLDALKKENFSGYMSHSTPK